MVAAAVSEGSAATRVTKAARRIVIIVTLHWVVDVASRLAARSTWKRSRLEFPKSNIKLSESEI
jgi:hypothetical protein